VPHEVLQTAFESVWRLLRGVGGRVAKPVYRKKSHYGPLVANETFENLTKFSYLDKAVRVKVKLFLVLK
jgi:hypothetical protein